MEEQFVPYRLVLKLKELGFDEECMGYWITSSTVVLSLGKRSKSGPLWQQAFDWFREEKDLLNHLTTHLNTWGEDGALETSYGYRIMTDKDGWKCDVWEQLSQYNTYEEARLACLEKLIEIVEDETK